MVNVSKTLLFSTGALLAFVLLFIRAFATVRDLRPGQLFDSIQRHVISIVLGVHIEASFSTGLRQLFIIIASFLQQAILLNI